MEAGHLLLVFARGDLLRLGRDLVLALAVLALTSDIVALLFRPLGIAALAFLVSAVALLLAWGVTAPHGWLTLVFVSGALGHAAITQRDVARRIDFSVGSVSASQLALLVVLLLVAVAALYLGATSYTREEGFSIPEQYSDEFAERLAARVAAAFPSLLRQQVHESVQSHTGQLLTEELERIMAPVTPYVPIAAAIALFLPLLAVSYVLSWVILPVLWIVLALFRAVGLTRIAIEAVEVKRLVLS